MTFISEKERIFGGLFGVAAGDAVGLTFEGMMPGPRYNLSVTGGGQFSLPAGAVTDDTMMTLSLLETYLSYGTFDREAFLLCSAESSNIRQDHKDTMCTFGTGMRF